MKEIFSISTGRDVAKAKPTIKASEEIEASSTKETSKDFLSIMFEQIKGSIAASSQESKLDIKLDNIEQELNTKNDKKSLDNHLLEDLLKVISLLKNPDAKVSSFPSLSNKLEKLINSETALKELKEVKNITDLLKLSKKYDLGLEKISVKNIDFETLKKEFPILAKKEFFVAPKEENTKIVAETVKKEAEIKPTVLNINNIEKPKTETKKEPTLFEKIMSTPKEEKKETALHVNKEITKDKLVDEKKEIVSTKITEEVKKTVKVVQEEAPKTIVIQEKKEVVVQDKKEAIHVEVEKELKKPEVTRINELKVESNTPKKGMIENILQGLKSDRQETTKTAPSQANQNQKVEIKTEESLEVKTEPVSNRVDLKPTIKTDTLASKQLTPSKDTFNNFAADFKEKLENYKPPFMRVQLALNPKGLGEVDVVIVNRGNNLHVNITSNTNTMSVFTQNQAEFKNSLVNMGFTNLEMNFSDQREKQEQHNKNNKETSDFFEEESLEEETTSIELVVPRYI